MRNLLLLFCFLCSFPVYAATYYVDGSAANDSGNGSSGSPKKYIRSGVALLSSGDTLIIANGTYTGDSNMLSRLPSQGGNYDEWINGVVDGASGAYTTIQAQTDWGVIIDGEGTRNGLYLDSISYLKIQGIHIRNSLGSPFRFDDSDHIKIIKCAGEEGRSGAFWLARTSYSLVEDCFSWGRGTYSFVTTGNAGTSYYNVFRRCVSRRDAHYSTAGGNHYASFVTYWSNNNYFQNCISIDGEVHQGGAASDPATVSVLYTANGSANYSAVGCISINDAGQIGQFESSASPILIDNCSFHLNPSASTFGVLLYGDTVTISNSLFYGAKGTGDWQGIGLGQVSGTSYSFKNNIIYGNNWGLARVTNGSHTYNIFYNNSLGNFSESSAGTGEVTNRNPLTNGLLYPTRIETSSYLSTAGESSGVCGPTIVNRIGADGTIYGETGWNTDSGVALWPFPNQDTIRTKMRTYTGTTNSADVFVAIDGTRGFCADGETLTHYIMNYLGNGDPYSGDGEPATVKSSVSGNVLISGGVLLN